MRKRIHWQRIDKDTFAIDEPVNDIDGFSEDDDFNQMNSLQDHVDWTPFGTFHKRSFQNPHVLYNYDFMYIGHMVGFNANSSNFYTIHNGKKRQTIDLIEGISIWRVIDAHKIVFIPAFLYDPHDVMKSIEKALLQDEYIEEDQEDKKSFLIDEAIKLSEGYADLKHAVGILPNGKIVSYSVNDTDYDDNLKLLKEIAEEDPQNTILIVDGELLD